MGDVKTFEVYEDMEDSSLPVNAVWTDGKTFRLSMDGAKPATCTSNLIRMEELIKRRYNRPLLVKVG